MQIPMGISRAITHEELLKIAVDNIQDKENWLVVEWPDTKMKIGRRFVISNMKFIKCYRKYAIPLINYHKEKCTEQFSRINKIL